MPLRNPLDIPSHFLSASKATSPSSSNPAPDSPHLPPFPLSLGLLPPPFLVLGVELRTSCMLGKFSTTKPHFQFQLLSLLSPKLIPPISGVLGLLLYILFCTLLSTPEPHKLAAPYPRTRQGVPGTLIRDKPIALAFKWPLSWSQILPMN